MIRSGGPIDRLLPFAISFVVTCVFFIDVCGWVFDCGCRSLWAGADAACNVHGPGRHCPLCSGGVVTYAGVMATICVPQLAVSTRTTWSRATRMSLCLVLFPVAMIATSLLLGWTSGYWQDRF